MEIRDARTIFEAVDRLSDASSDLILAIDKIADEKERKALRSKYASLIAQVEKDFVYDICASYPEFSQLKPSLPSKSG